MAAKVITGEAMCECRPMQWHAAPGTVPQAGRVLQDSLLGESKAPEPDFELRLARLQAKLASVEAERERLVGEAREAGRREGEAAGRRVAEAEMQPVLERLATSLKDVSELPAALRAQAEVDLIRLAVAIAQRILQRELNVDPAVITGLVRVGLEKVRAQDVVRVRVCPEHQAAVRECLMRLGAPHVEVSSDPTQERGSMIFETSRGKLDVSIGTQLREIERGLTDRLRGQA